MNVAVGRWREGVVVYIPPSLPQPRSRPLDHSRSKYLTGGPLYLYLHLHLHLHLYLYLYLYLPSM
ncbi:hypothetical protein J6590_040808, partial [Homalodisca vitripennis]